MIDMTPFFEKYPKAMDSQTVPQDIIEKYRGVFPKSIIEIWEKHGFGGYAKGMFWMINPNDYQDYVSKWIDMKEYDDYYPIMRTAFGDLILMYNLLIDDPMYKYLRFITLDVRHCLLNKITISLGSFINDFLIDSGRLLSGANIEPEFLLHGRFKLGILNSKECYGFDPLLALGGKEKSENIIMYDFNQHLDLVTTLLKTPIVDKV